MRGNVSRAGRDASGPARVERGSPEPGRRGLIRCGCGAGHREGRLRQHDKRTRASSRFTRLLREAFRSTPQGSRYLRDSPVAVASFPPYSSGVRMSMTGTPASRSCSSLATSTLVTSARSGSLAMRRAATTSIDLSTGGSSGRRVDPSNRMQDSEPDWRMRANPSILSPPRQIRVTSRSRLVLGRSAGKHHLVAGTRPCRVPYRRDPIEQRPCARNSGAQCMHPSAQPRVVMCRPMPSLDPEGRRPTPRCGHRRHRDGHDPYAPRKRVRAAAWGAAAPHRTRRSKCRRGSAPLERCRRRAAARPPHGCATSRPDAIPSRCCRRRAPCASSSGLFRNAPGHDTRRLPGEHRSLP